MTTTDILFIVLILYDKERKLKILYKLILNKLQGFAYPVALSYVLPTPYHSFIVQPLLPGLHQNCCTWNIQVRPYILPLISCPLSHLRHIQLLWDCPMSSIVQHAAHQRPAAPGISRLGQIS